MLVLKKQLHTEKAETKDESEKIINLYLMKIKDKLIKQSKKKFHKSLLLLSVALSVFIMNILYFDPSAQISWTFKVFMITFLASSGGLSGYAFVNCISTWSERFKKTKKFTDFPYEEKKKPLEDNILESYYNYSDEKQRMMMLNKIRDGREIDVEDLINLTNYIQGLELSKKENIDKDLRKERYSKVLGITF